MCSGASEAFGAVQTLSDPTEHAKSEEVGHRTSEPLDSDWQCASESVQCVCGRGRILCAHWFSMHSIPSFLVSCFGVLA